jgi:hypothetical protein
VKTNLQILDEITAAMADAWLAACDRRIIIGTLVPTKFMVIDHRQGARSFGPASADECRLFVRGSCGLVLFMSCRVMRDQKTASPRQK